MQCFYFTLAYGFWHFQYLVKKESFIKLVFCFARYPCLKCLRWSQCTFLIFWYVVLHQVCYSFLSWPVVLHQVCIFTFSVLSHGKFKWVRVTPWSWVYDFVALIWFVGERGGRRGSWNYSQSISRCGYWSPAFRYWRSVWTLFFYW